MSDELSLTPTIRNLIPDNLLAELIQWRDTFAQGAWRIGDIANEIVALALANEIEVNRLDIFASVGRVVGKSGRTVRMYATVAGFYPPEVRNTYGVLPFSHFALGMTYRGDRAGIPVWQALLETSTEYFVTHGIPPSAERLQHLFSSEREQTQLALQPGGNPAPIDFFAHPVMDDALPGDGEDAGIFADYSEPQMQDVQPAGDVAVLTPRQAELNRLLSQIENLLSPLPGMLDLLRGIYPDVARELAQAVALIRRAELSLQQNGVIDTPHTYTNGDRRGYYSTNTQYR